MTFTEAENLVTDLKSILINEYWGDIYYLMQNALLPEVDQEYDIYVEYHGEFNFDLSKVLIDYCKDKTITFALQTYQIIIW